MGVIKFSIMLDDGCVLLTQSCYIRGLSKKQYNVLVDVCLKLNDLRNCAVEKTPFVKSSDGKHFNKINFKQVIGNVKKEFKDKYSLIQAGVADAAIKKHVDSFNGFVALKNKSVDGEYDLKVNSPHKHDSGRLHNIIIPRGSITSSKKKLSEGYIELPLSRKYKKELESKDCRPKIKIPENIRDKNLIQVEIIPINNGRMFKANFTYQEEIDPWNLDKEKVMGIDVGVNNFVTIVTTERTPYIVDGRHLKSQIAFKCKKTAYYQSILNKQGLKRSKRIGKINTKFKGIQNNFLNQATNFILQVCQEQDVGTIVLGYNKNFQYKSNMGPTQNQIFTQYAFKKFIDKLLTKCKIHDITLIITEESYTSKSSFLDDDILPTYNENDEEKKHKFKGKRIKRGLYKTLKGILINADVNAACNIIRKSKQKFNKERLCKWAQDAPIKIKLHKNNL